MLVVVAKIQERRRRESITEAKSEEDVKNINMASVVLSSPLMRVFTSLMALLHLVTFVVSFLANLVASDYASSASRAKVDQKLRLFRRLTVLQCRIAQIHNLWRIPLTARLFFWDWEQSFIQEVVVA